jgi:FKBP-type peptidyl-prolyl cis-trans isomerase
MNCKKYFGFSILILIFIITGCDSKGTWERQERQQISDYLKTIPDSTYVLKPSGLYYIELKAGTGRSPVNNDTAYFKYIGTFLGGVAFDSTTTVTTAYGYIMGSMTIVSGVDEGLKYMKTGGKARLLTPSNLAFGQQGVWGLIPGFTPLLWDIELISVKAGPGK